MDLFATLREYDVPVDHRAVVWADITRPDGSQFTVKLAEMDPGRFATSLSGLYAMRVRAMGSTFRGVAFQREQTLSTAVYPGGDDPPKPGDNGAFWCWLLHCLVSDKVIDPKLIERLCESGVDIEEPSGRGAPRAQQGRSLQLDAQGSEIIR